MSRTPAGSGRSGRPEGPEVRGAIGVVVSRFPTVTETFILREIREMERQGQPVRLVPLLRDDPPVVHDDARPWIGRAHFTPFLSWEILESNREALFADPRKYLSVLAALVRGMAGSPGFLIRSLALFPKAVHLARRLEREGIRHVHAHFATHPLTVAWIMSRLSTLSFSVTAHAHDIFVDRTFLGEKLGAASFVRVISDFNRRYLLSMLPELDADKVRVVHTGVDVARYADGPSAPSGSGRGDPPARREAGGEVERASPLVLTVASLRPYKGLPVLLDACRHLRDSGVDVRVEVAGDGPLREELERRAARAGLADRIRFLGAVPERRVPELLSRASIFVLPSVPQEDGQMEGIPVALMEAMAAELPVVTSELSGIPELVEHGVTGILLMPGDAEALARAVRSLLEAPDRARALGRRGREKVREDFAIDRCVARLVELLQDHVDPPPPEVRERLRASEPLRRRASVVGLRRVHRSRDSWVAELLLADGVDGAVRWPRDVVLKVHHDRSGASSSASRRARTEFEALRDLAHPARCDPPGTASEASGAGNASVPLPLHLDEAEAALLVTRCDGSSLLDLVRRFRWTTDPGHRRDLPASFRRAGLWLRRFQERPVASPAAAVGAVLDRVTSETLERIDGLRGDLLGAREARSLSGRLRELRIEAEAKAETVYRHGDFWLGNVFVSPDGHVSVIDFEGVGEGHPFEDPANFVVQLSTYFAYPGLAERRRALTAAFVEGYGDGSTARAAGFDLCRRAAAARLLEPGRRDGRASRRSTAWFRRRILLKILRGEPA